jgi:hypothetical protein
VETAPIAGVSGCGIGDRESGFSLLLPTGVQHAIAEADAIDFHDRNRPVRAPGPAARKLRATARSLWVPKTLLTLEGALSGAMGLLKTSP